MTLQGDWDPLDDILLFSHLLEGRFTIRSCATGGSEIDAGVGDTFAYDPEARMSVRWHDIRMAQVQIERRAVDRPATELRGEHRVGGTVGFDLARPVSSVKGQRWKRLMQYVTSDVSTTPLVPSQVLRLIVSTALGTFPNTTMTTARAGTRRG